MSSGLFIVSRKMEIIPMLKSFQFWKECSIVIVHSDWSMLKSVQWGLKKKPLRPFQRGLSVTIEELKDPALTKKEKKK